ncbi:hypothetical protein FHW83_000542 [Duganella sp. SG902]|uniref:DUF29 domain-containing protein n=1 Tax=Duganella sp. SG902 TaxID=2587016 RepID=UPI00159D59EA|nr:DUF29 domain-containing protein [Duganella sp. SG902]NVM74782.1 hypothetical protein [Duganella sp. SG902]
MSNLYEHDFVAWAEQQAHLLRTGQWSRLDIDNIVEEIADVGKSERHALQSRLRVLIAHLLKWTHQPARRGRSWRRTIKDQRAAIALHLKRHPSLKPALDDPDWLESAFADARTDAFDETGIPDLPLNLPWSIEQLMDQDFLPE